MTTETILLLIVLASGLYMAWNIGANDVANAIGTSVGSGALTLKHAVILAACLEFTGAFLFGSYVSHTVQTGIVNPQLFESDPLLFVYGMLASLISAGVWLQLASYFGWPVSTTHSIVGAIVGFGLINYGLEAINWSKVSFIFSSWILSPLLGGVISYLVFNLFRRQIFYTSHPLAAAKKVTPWIVFPSFFMFSMLLLLNGALKWLDTPLVLPVSITTSLIVGGFAAWISSLIMRRIKLGEGTPTSPMAYGPEVVVELDKAKKHIQRVVSSARGDLLYSASYLMDEIETMAHTLKHRIDHAPEDTEYKAVERIFSRLQWVSASFMAFAHGANDVANAIGPLSACITVIQTGTLQFAPSTPLWILAMGGAGIVVGLMTWGWRVIETIGRKLTELTPSRGFAAELGAATTIVFASRLGLPISTTHTLVGAVLGVACARGIGALNLSTMRDILISWIVTIPAGASFAILAFYGLKFLSGIFSFRDFDVIENEFKSDF